VRVASSNPPGRMAIGSPFFRSLYKFAELTPCNPYNRKKRPAKGINRATRDAKHVTFS